MQISQEKYNTSSIRVVLIVVNKYCYKKWTWFKLHPHKRITTSCWPRDSISWPIDGFDDRRWRCLEPYDKTERLSSRQIRSTLWSDWCLLYSNANHILPFHVTRKKSHTNILCYRHGVSCVGSKGIDQCFWTFWVLLLLI